MFKFKTESIEGGELSFQEKSKEWGKRIGNMIFHREALLAEKDSPEDDETEYKWGVEVMELYIDMFKALRNMTDAPWKLYKQETINGRRELGGVTIGLDIGGHILEINTFKSHTGNWVYLMSIDQNPDFDFNFSEIGISDPYKKGWDFISSEDKFNLIDTAITVFIEQRQKLSLVGVLE